MPQQYPAIDKRCKVPISKRCKICDTKKLLNEFNINQKSNDMRNNICKECESICSCGDCTTAKMFDVFDANIDHMLALIKNGLQIPDTIKEKIGWLADLCKV